MNQIMPGNYLVTGSTGTVGTSALNKLKNIPGVNVRAVRRNRHAKVYGDNIIYVNANLEDHNQCKEVVKDIDYVFMFAGVSSPSPVRANDPVSSDISTLMINTGMLAASYFAKVKKLLWISSTSVYPDSQKELHEEDAFLGDPMDDYFSVGWMTRYVEILCRQYATKLKNSFPIIIMRPSIIYGPSLSFDPKTSYVLPALVKKVVDRMNPIEVWGDGKNVRSFIHSDDVMDACICAFNKIDCFDVFNIGSEEKYTVNELLQMIIELDHFNDASLVYNDNRPSSVKERIIDFSKASKILKFKPQITIREGISQLIEEYRKINDISKN